MNQKRRGMLGVAGAVLFVAICPVALWAQDAAPKPAEPQPAAAPALPRSPSAQVANIQLAIVLTDKIESRTVAEEPVRLLLADRMLGRLRRRLPSNADRSFELDVTPEIVGSRVKISMTVSYNAANP